MIFQKTPPVPSVGTLWHDTSDDTCKVYDGTSWKSLSTDKGHYVDVYVKNIVRSRVFIKYGYPFPNDKLDIFLDTEKEYAMFLLKWKE